MQRIIALSLALAVAGNTSFAQRPVSPAWTLVEDLRIGEDQGMKSFSDVRSVVATKNGNIFVLDFKAQQIRVFDAKGNFLKLAARDGAGPGEIRNANGLAVGENDIVWVNDPSNGRFSLYRADGSFYKQVLARNWGYSYTWGGAIDGSGRAVEMFYVSKPAGSLESTIRMTTEAGTADTVPTSSCKSDVPQPNPAYLMFAGAGGSRRNMAIPYLPMSQLKMTRSGNVWCSPASEYRLWVGPAGKPNQEVVSLKVAPPAVSSEERKQALDRIDSIVKNYGPLQQGDPSQIPKVKPVITDVQVDDASRAWVRLTGSPDNAPEFDVFDLAGKPVAHVRGKGKISAYVTSISGGYVYTTALDENDVPTIVRYRIVR